jgi:hypothetical protein
MSHYFLYSKLNISKFVVLKVEIKNENMKNLWFPIPIELDELHILTLGAF